MGHRCGLTREHRSGGGARSRSAGGGDDDTATVRVGQAWDGGRGTGSETHGVQGAAEDVGVAADSAGGGHGCGRPDLDGAGQDGLGLVWRLVEVEVGREGVSRRVLCTLRCRHDGEGRLDGLHSQPL